MVDRSLSLDLGVFWVDLQGGTQSIAVHRALDSARENS